MRLSMLYDERKDKILQQLNISPIVKLSDLVQILCVSIDTIRRDLKTMETEGLLECIRGGARIPSKMLQFSDFKGREIINTPQKLQLVQKALSFIHKDDVIMLNSGTTTALLAKEISKKSISCTIITNNIAAVSILMKTPSLKVIVVGGELNANEQSLYGPQCEAELKKYYPDLCFLSINAVHPEKGFTDFRFQEIPIMQTMKKNSMRTIAVMDSSKLNRVSKKTLFTSEQLDTIVMDDHVSDELKKLYASSGIHIL